MNTKRTNAIASALATLAALSCGAADIVLAPPAAGGVAITDAAGSAIRLRVGEEGIVTLPGLGSVPLPATGLCVEVATGRLGTCTAGLPSGNLSLVNSTASAGNILKSGLPFIHNAGSADNFFAGLDAGNLTLTGVSNVGVGSSAMRYATTGFSNTAIGTGALGNASTGSFNVLVGSGAGTGVTMGDFNTVVGTNAFSSTTTAFQNVGLGGGVLADVTSGSGNLALGYGSGAGITTGSHNVLIARGGSLGTNESGVIRIGNFLQNKAFIAGIRGVTTDLNDAVGVMIDGSGQLGTVSSSRRFKDGIADMAEASSGLMQLRPVTFHYRTDADPAGRRLQYGLVAEEVAQVYPGLVATTPDGQTETVLYHFLAPMLLNEMQKQQRTIEAQAAQIADLAARAGRVDALEQELAAIKHALGLR